MMRLQPRIALFGATFATVAFMGCEGRVAMDSADLETSDQKASYGIGLNIGSQLTETKDRLDRPAFLRGVEDALQGNESAVPSDELQVELQTFAEEIQNAAQQDFDRVAAENSAAGDAYLAENRSKEGVMTTESGLQYEVLSQGDGPMPGSEDQVQLHYRGTLIDGTEFDSSYERGEPAQFGVGGVIPGFSEALQLMSVGSHFRVVIPSEIGYGPQGTGGPIGPNATLIFEIELLEIIDPA